LILLVLISSRQRPAKISNRIILDNLCKSLDKAKDKWADKLPGVLWAYRTTKCVPTDETPFSLAYGMEAIIPVDINMPTFRVEGVVQNQMIPYSEERRQPVQIHIAAYQQQIQAAHHKKVKSQKFQVRDLVLKRMIQSTRQKDQKKLEPNWEGPYIIVTRGAKGRTPWSIRMGTNSISNEILFT